jgi:hypothetical protein
MRLQFSPNDEVCICIPELDDAAGPDVVFEGRVVEATDDTLSISLIDEGPRSFSCVLPSRRFIVRKRTPFGLLEFDGTGYLHNVENRLTLWVRLLGDDRRIQRRDSCRTEVHSAVRYGDLKIADIDRSEWRNAELRDVSRCGVSLLLQDNLLDVGHKLLIEFDLNETIFSLPAIVCRLEQTRRHARVCGLQYLDLDSRQRDRIATAIIHLQIGMIASTKPLMLERLLVSNV